MPCMEEVEKISIKAKRLYEQGLFKESFSLYRQLAESNYPDSQIFTGWCYQEGIGVQKNEDKAYKWYLRAADLDSERGMFYVGRYLTYKNKYSEAISWFNKAAKKNYSPALFLLGVIHDQGLGVEVDKNIAYKYFKKSAESGHLYAKRKISIYYILGRKGVVNIVFGAELFFKAVLEIVILRLKDKHATELLM